MFFTSLSQQPTTLFSDSSHLCLSVPQQSTTDLLNIRFRSARLNFVLQHPKCLPLSLLLFLFFLFIYLFFVSHLIFSSSSPAKVSTRETFRLQLVRSASKKVSFSFLIWLTKVRSSVMFIICLEMDFVHLWFCSLVVMWRSMSRTRPAWISLTCR